MRVTADTNFLLSATQWTYSVSHKLLKKLIGIDCKIFTTSEILSEFAEVLARDFHYTKEEIRGRVEKLIPILTIVNTGKIINVVERDPDDNIIVACALASSSDYIITYDKDLLDIVEHNGIKIVRPEILLEMLGK